jgi:hypothetical protein
LIAAGKPDAARDRVEEIRATLSNAELPFIEEGFAAYDEMLR